MIYIYMYINIYTKNHQKSINYYILEFHFHDLPHEAPRIMVSWFFNQPTHTRNELVETICWIQIHGQVILRVFGP